LRDETLVEEDGIKIELIKETQEAVLYQQATVLPQVSVSHPAQAVATTVSATTAGTESVKEVGVEMFLSPMVGTYYATPSPDAPDFVKVGDKVKKGQSLCIIEAMKLFNEIEAEYNGTIMEILVNRQDAVEFGQPLFKIKKDA